MSDVLLIACYELGHPPLSLAWPQAGLRQAGLSCRVVDLAVENLDSVDLASARLIALATPMHTALRLAVEVAPRIRAANPAAHVVFFGLYAWLNADYLLAGPADSVIGGEAEAALVRLAQAVRDGRDPASVPGVRTRHHPVPPSLERVQLPVPDRLGLRGLDQYARYEAGGRQVLAGYVEATRGCRHTCAHCPITPIYQGRFFAVPREVVLADIRQQVQAGARHITFGDPDFLNGPTHALRLARALNAEFPGLTFDFTAKVEHLLRHADLIPELAQLGCAFVISAIESLSPLVLERLNKGHTRADIERALEITDEAGIALLPTLVAFTPWTTAEDYLELIDFIHARGLQRHVPPVQLGIRLLLPPGSPLAQAEDAAAWLGPLVPEAFTHAWAHPDARLDALQSEVALRVEAAGRAGEAAERTHAAIRGLAYARLRNTAPPDLGQPLIRPQPPRLTENWFC